ncbi:site-2 protease family protein [Pelagibius marinus]|uniref:site-2 protease family protein n=1 Tax=Pelagibius marinus TaxID=2762760 RepID=UPI00187290D1|nr:site-2 protease family protein [Pelagibius marinus]
MNGRSITLFELLGFKIRVDISWIFLALLVTWSLAKGVFPAWYEDAGLSQAAFWWMGIAGMAGLVFSLIFHELSHSLVARRYGLPIKGITLFIFGGVAEMTEEPKSAKVEFWMAIAGPIASFVLALAFWLLAGLGRAQGLPVAVTGVLGYLAFINLLLGGFNLIPAFPMDGGRVLRAALWYWRGDFRQATRIASGAGKGFGMGLMLLGLLSVVTGNFIGGMWWFLIGLFVRGAAEASYQQMVTRRLFEGEPVRRFMTHETVAVPPDLPLTAFVEDYVYEYHYDLFPVVSEGHLRGCISTRQVKTVPREAWPYRSVADLMAPCNEENTVDPGMDAIEAMALMRRTGASRLIVAVGDRLVGIVVMKDMLELFSLKMDLEGQR